MVAILGKVLLHVPPVVALDSVILAATQTVVGPVIGDTVPVALTVTLSVAATVPHELVIV